MVVFAAMCRSSFLFRASAHNNKGVGGGPKVFQQYKTPLGNIQLAAVEESFLHAYMALKSSDVNDIASIIRNKS